MCRPECWMESNATSSTTSGRTMRRKPWSSIVISRNFLVNSAISASVRPLYALPTLTSMPDRGDHDVQSRQRALQFQPREAAPPRRVRAERVLGHQPLVAALARLLENAVQVIGAGRLLQPREEERVLEAEAFEQLAPGGQGLVEQRAAVEPEQVEDHEHDRHLAPELVVDLLAAEAMLQLEEAQHAAVSMREHLAVEEHIMADARRGLHQLRERARRLLQVTGEKLDTRALAVQLAAHAVVLLLGPDGAGAMRVKASCGVSTGLARMKR